ncbi:MAG: hypothetical protein J6Q22_10985 [Prevotella sp.]|nr:hypothetical protein [Prevotella sp.]
MTYRIVATNRSPKEYLQSRKVGYAGKRVPSWELVNDMIFDNENLSRLCKVNKKDWIDDGAFLMTKAHALNGIKTLTDLKEKVASMPFTEYGEAEHIYYDSEAEKAVNRYEGSQENIAILMAVESVLSRAYHFSFPWESKTYNPVDGMIEALENVVEYIDAHPKDSIIALYY